ncbi:cathepsin B-like cysteine proteinase 3 [Lycorma delicatula]|uniref:cathepsin B-like cysteine proteinase 3 n=1 Tax=Lycorma delicatula TaxID=130591 RepID=UPI003F51032F
MKRSFAFCYLFIILLIPGFIEIGYSVKIDSMNILSDEFIREINDQQKYWKAGKNFHFYSELKNLLSIKLKEVQKLERKETEIYYNISKNFDSRTNWPQCNSIRLVNTQGNCASSYAIVPAAVFQDRLCIQKNIHRTGSSDQLLTCCKVCGGGCFGGHVEKSFTYINKVGLVTGGTYRSNIGCRPYRIENCETIKGLPACKTIRRLTPSCYVLKCTNNRYITASYDKDKMKMKQVYAVPSKVVAIKSEIIKNGPVSASLIIYEDFFNYKRGVYYHTSGLEVGQHTVKLIGWGVTKKSKRPYWLAINSWGGNWGDQGTFKIKLGVNECNIESNVLTGSFI